MKTSAVPTVSRKRGKKNEGVQEKELRVSARCLIKVGDICEIDYPHHHDPDSERFHVLYDEQRAKVVKIHADHDGVDLKMLSGEARGKVVEKVSPKILFFPGPFIKN